MCEADGLRAGERDDGDVGVLDQPGADVLAEARAAAGTRPARAPAATSASASRHATAGVCSAGFRITGLPAASAATVIPHGMASGKFHGAMTAVTPLPW